MDILNDFRITALFLIFPDGTIKKELVDRRLIHLRYYIDLYNEDKFIKDFANEHNVFIPKSFYNSKMIVPYEIDRDFAREGVIAFHNMNIYETLTDDDFIINTPPQFYITLPCDLSEEQKNIIKELSDKYEMSSNFYGIYDDNKLKDISYDEFKHVLASKSK